MYFGITSDFSIRPYLLLMASLNHDDCAMIELLEYQPLDLITTSPNPGHVAHVRLRVRIPYTPQRN